MAVAEAVRRGGSLLLRTLAVGGLATAAWLVCAGAASAEDHSDEVTTTFDAVNMTLEEQRAATAELLSGVLPQMSFGFAYQTAWVESRPLDVPVVMAHRPVHDEQEEESYSTYSGDDTGYSHSGYSHNGSVSNTMPAPMYEAKVAAKVAARAAAALAALAPPAPVTEPAPTPRAVVQPLAPVTPVTVSSDAMSEHEVTWEVPEPSAPSPAPKQAPAPSAPTASSSSTDNGGGHRGGVLVSLTGQSSLKPSAAWSVERRDGGRSPGSVPGLPSTSPD